MRILDETDAKKTLTASPLENWKRPPGRLCTTWMKTIQQDLTYNYLTLNEAIDMAHNHLPDSLSWQVRTIFNNSHCN